MAAIDDIIFWARKSLPKWQADAVRRLLSAGDRPLSEEDYSEILVLAKQELSILMQPTSLKSIPPSQGTVSGIPSQEVDLRLLSIENVRNVNIIKSDQKQSFAENGITVVYGENGSGKSGYARILKLACQARDKELILPNVFVPSQGLIPSAILNIKHDGTLKDIRWTQGVEPDPIFTNISVFDGRCARVITDEKNEISYLPYGCDIFGKLAEVVLKVRSLVLNEISVPDQIQDYEIVAGTKAAEFLNDLSETTTPVQIATACTWSDVEEEILTSKTELASKSSPEKAIEEASKLERVAQRIFNAASGSESLSASCRKLSNHGIKNILVELKAAKEAHRIAVSEREIRDSLNGVASTNEWELLYKAAKAYSENIAYPGEDFPNTSIGALCVLCQQPLSDQAIDRFQRFKRFMEDSTSTILESKRNAITSTLEQLTKLNPLSNEALDSLCDELKTFSNDASEMFKAFHNEITKIKNHALELLRNEEEEASMDDWPISPATSLQSIASGIKNKITEITEAAKPEEYLKLSNEIRELKSRKALFRRKADVILHVQILRKNASLKKAASLLKTTSITNEGKQIIARHLTPELKDAFKSELEFLDSEKRLPISFEAKGSSGETLHELVLQGAITHNPLSKVLSEGESRVIGIAGFLSELKLAPHSNPIVLDDPASSLDHIYYSKIAERLVQEGAKRQVIIFTHNIGFLMELRDAQENFAKAGTSINMVVHSVRRDSKNSGISTEGAPWSGLPVTQRCQMLEERVHKIKHLYLDEREEYNEKAALIYGLLRECWESCIEDDLLYKVVCRYRNSVQPMKLIEVDVESSDFNLIDLNYSKASKWFRGHDRSKDLHDARPSPSEILSDIAILREYSKKFKSRHEKTKSRRKAELHPQAESLSAKAPSIESV